MQTTTTTKLKPYQKTQAAWRFLNDFEKGTEKSVCKRFGIDQKTLEKAVDDFKKGNFKKTKSWNPNWSIPTCTHHVLDTSVMVDIEKGAPKGSDIDLLMDPNFDPINGLLHINWSEHEMVTLCASLPYRILEIIRDSEQNDELYFEAIEFGRSEYFHLICQHFDLDAEELLASALKIKSKCESSKKIIQTK
jgi:hypothetical protein